MPISKEKQNKERSIKVGDEICLMKIIPLGTIWK
jgi:hypothetical protein